MFNMGNEFDELFERYFGEPSKKRKGKKSKKSAFNPFDMDMFNESNGISNNLGEPDDIQRYTEDGIDYERKVWHTKDGDVIQMSAKSSGIDFTPDYFNTHNIPFGEISTNSNFPYELSEKSLDEQLQLAVKNEKYEDAAKLRDLIKNTKEAKNK